MFLSEEALNGFPFAFQLVATNKLFVRMIPAFKDRKDSTVDSNLTVASRAMKTL